MPPSRRSASMSRNATWTFFFATVESASSEAWALANIGDAANMARSNMFVFIFFIKLSIFNYQLSIAIVLPSRILVKSFIEVGILVRKWEPVML